MDAAVVGYDRRFWNPWSRLRFRNQARFVARQSSTLVRDETNSSSTAKMGRFDSATQMKAAQETILEVVRHEQVVAQALKAVGPNRLG